MSPPGSVKLVLGTHLLGTAILAGDTATTFLETFHKFGHTEVDSAWRYPSERFGESERVLSRAGPGVQISTKLTPPFDRASITAGIDSSLERLNGKKIETLYLHLPDRDTSMSETLEAVDAAFQAGKFKRFGVSNFNPEELKQMIEICESKDFVRPTVYQGQYNLLARKGEEELFPLLRKHGIAFYAYSPAAGGMMTGKVSREAGKGEGRWSDASPYGAAYRQDKIFAASKAIRDEAAVHGITGHAAALRWCVYHSILDERSGDAVIVGASSITQLEDNSKITEEGRLPAALVKVIEDMWPSIQAVAPWA
ncbi:hypothetical protein LTR56_001184 [Elasticomyces elasticus]|nr:hypothetical protein LTR22_016221 [Elasticomyces elasticus]KAK3659820.1 hypothetical protein LTR56_001184 [Elasticomyces elasticus]KAK4914303.1 hypothetical protein LTR49_017441 [Elasticomyces elasticus]KAK5769105.1 hypothetical protein LTS12_000819 [Elasticomyces elasticus]